MGLAKSAVAVDLRIADRGAGRARAVCVSGKHTDWPARCVRDVHALAKTIRELVPAAVHDTTQYANNRTEDYGRLKARLRTDVRSPT